MKKSLEGVWLVLILFTIFAYVLGELKFVTTYMMGILLITTFIKGHLIIDYFMGLKNIQSKYSIIPTLWLTIVMLSIGVAYYLPLTTK